MPRESKQVKRRKNFSRQLLWNLLLCDIRHFGLFVFIRREWNGRENRGENRRANRIEEQIE